MLPAPCEVSSDGDRGGSRACSPPGRAWIAPVSRRPHSGLDDEVGTVRPERVFGPRGGDQPGLFPVMAHHAWRCQEAEGALAVQVHRGEICACSKDGGAPSASAVAPISGQRAVVVPYGCRRRVAPFSASRSSICGVATRVPDAAGLPEGALRAVARLPLSATADTANGAGISASFAAVSGCSAKWDAGTGFEPVTFRL